MEYEEKANQLLKDFGLKLECEYLGSGKHYETDTQKRDIYELCLYTIAGRRLYLSVDYGDSIHNTELNKTNKKRVYPTAYDLLSCLIVSDPETFNDFCDNYGYDKNSRSAERIYFKVCEEWEQVRECFTPEQLEQIKEILK